MGSAPPAVPIDRDEFAAPNGSIVAIAGAVPGDAQKRRVQPVIGHAGQHMGKMVLHAMDRRPHPRGDLRGVVVGVKVAGHSHRSQAMQASQPVNSACKGSPRLRPVEVADMRAEKDLAGETGGYRALHVAAERQNRPIEGRQRHRQRSISPRPPQHGFASADHPHHRVVDRAQDRPVVDQEQIGNAAEPLERLGFVGDNGLAAPIAAGGDDGKSEIAQQQMMERCARQHDAEGTIAGRDRVRPIAGCHPANDAAIRLAPARLRAPVARVATPRPGFAPCRSS